MTYVYIQKNNNNVVMNTHKHKTTTHKLIINSCTSKRSLLSIYYMPYSTLEIVETYIKKTPCKFDKLPEKITPKKKSK